MKKSMINQTHIEGYVYENNLELKTSGPNSKNPGTEFISGTLGVATDDAMLNVIQVHFTYVTEITAKGKTNATYTILKAIIDGKIGNVMDYGKENAGKVRIDSAIDLNEWYDKDDNLVSVKRNEGGFVHQISELGKPETRNTFNVDMVITGVKRIEANEERGLPEKVNVKGYIFNFRGDALPVDFSVVTPEAALNYFENLGATSKSPVFTRVQGVQINETVVRIVEEEGAWGTVVKEVPSSHRDFVINWTLANPYVWDDEDTILASELSEKLKKRELDLANMKKRRDEYQASKNNPLAAASSKAPKSSDYDF